jgi:leucyl aminopeptidase
VVPDQRVAATRFEPLAAVNAGVFLARDLTNEPADAVYPESFAAAALELRKLGVKVEVLDEAAMARLGMGAILAVGKGSNRPPRMVIAHWQNSKQAPLAIVGKGITFDTGGYNLKTDATSIVRMNSDMAGAAAVLGTIKALALQNAPVNVVAVMALAENKISDRAMLPGDVIKSGSGLTIQVGNTDAEGRLVLADGLWYARDKYKPRAIVDIATLTGSKVGALGNYYAGIFSEHEALTQQLTSAGRQVDEEVWQLPLNSKFADEMKSDIADLNNNGKTTGASSAAWFLQQFTGDTPWAHLDIAGNALSSSDKGVHVTGATGYGVRLLTEWALKQP